MVKFKDYASQAYPRDRPKYYHAEIMLALGIFCSLFNMTADLSDTFSSPAYEINSCKQSFIIPVFL